MQSVRTKDSRVMPSKIVCVGQNYAAHIKELGNDVPDEMVVFFKPNSAISESLRTTANEAVHYEGELAFLVNNGGFSHVAFGLDLTRREVQSRLRKQGLPWERAKAFDGAAVFSEFAPFASVDALSLTLEINGATVQRGGFDLMIHKPAAVLEELKTFVTLADGDIVMTGTPAGVGPVKSGDEFCGRVYQGSEVLVSANWVAQL